VPLDAVVVATAPLVLMATTNTLGRLSPVPVSVTVPDAVPVVGSRRTRRHGRRWDRARRRSSCPREARRRCDPCRPTPRTAPPNGSWQLTAFASAIVTLVNATFPVFVTCTCRCTVAPTATGVSSAVLTTDNAGAAGAVTVRFTVLEATGAVSAVSTAAVFASVRSVRCRGVARPLDAVLGSTCSRVPRVLASPTVAQRRNLTPVPRVSGRRLRLSRRGRRPGVRAGGRPGSTPWGRTRAGPAGRPRARPGADP